MVAALVFTAAGSAKAETAKQTIGRLNVVLTTDKPPLSDETLDRTKTRDTQRDTVAQPALATLELGSRIRKLLLQADSAWTPGTVVLLCWRCGWPHLGCHAED